MPLFYSQEQKEKLIAIQDDPHSNQKPISMALGVAMLDALGEIQNTLQSIVDLTKQDREPQNEDDRVKDSESIKRGKVFYADLDGVIGSEQKGRRPVVVIQNDIGNAYSPTVVVVPATSKAKHALPTHVPVCKRDKLDDKTIFLCEQVRAIDKSRIGDFICCLTEETMKKIEDSLKVSFGMRNDHEDGKI